MSPVHKLGSMGPAPHHVIGIDVDTRAAHFAIIDTLTGRFQTNSCVWPVGDFSEGRRLIEARAHTIRFAEALQEHWPVMAAGVERPIAFRRPNPPLMMTCGVVVEAVGTATTVAPFLLGTSEWRKACGLPGNCDKAAVVEWARGHGWTGERVDQAEALGIAVAACVAWGVELPALRARFEDAA